MDFNMVGPILVLGISSMGSCVGCYIAGAASHAVMSRVERGTWQICRTLRRASLAIDLRLAFDFADEPRHPGWAPFRLFLELSWGFRPAWPSSSPPFSRERCARRPFKPPPSSPPFSANASLPQGSSSRSPSSPSSFRFCCSRRSGSAEAGAAHQREIGILREFACSLSSQSDQLRALVSLLNKERNEGDRMRIFLVRIERFFVMVPLEALYTRAAPRDRPGDAYQFVVNRGLKFIDRLVFFSLAFQPLKKVEVLFLQRHLLFDGLVHVLHVAIKVLDKSHHIS